MRSSYDLTDKIRNQVETTLKFVYVQIMSLFLHKEDFAVESI